jgi:hypothetical protein
MPGRFRIGLSARHLKQQDSGPKGFPTVFQIDAAQPGLRLHCAAQSRAEVPWDVGAPATMIAVVWEVCVIQDREVRRSSGNGG